MDKTLQERIKWSKWSILPKLINSSLESFYHTGLGVIPNVELLWKILDFPGSMWETNPNIFRLTQTYLNLSISLFFIFSPSVHYSETLTVLSLTLHSFSTKLSLHDYCLAINLKNWVWFLKWNKYFFDVRIPFLIPLYPWSTDCHCPHYNSPNAHKTKHSGAKSFVLFPSVALAFTWTVEALNTCE